MAQFRGGMNELMRQASPSPSAAVNRPAFEPNGHLPNQAIPDRHLGRVRLRTALVLSLSRWIAIGVIAGFAAGFATGLWTRVAMRLAGILTVDDRDQLERAFRRLTLEQRAVLVFHHYLGLPLPEAADRLGIPLGTAKSRLHHATAALRASLEADARTPSASQERLA